jgi:RNA polymerase sigma-70 factor (ECF subfamily)
MRVATDMHAVAWSSFDGLVPSSKERGLINAPKLLRQRLARPLRPRALDALASPPVHDRVDRAPEPVAPAIAERRDFERMTLPHLLTLRRCALRLSKSRADADDLVQETLLRAWRFWPRYVERDNCRAWLQRILTNVFCSEHRRNVRRRERLAAFAMSLRLTARDYEPAEPASTTSAPSLDDRFTNSLAALTPAQRRVLCLIDLQQRSYREAAADLACPIGTVMSRLHRARAALRTQFEGAAARA